MPAFAGSLVSGPGAAVDGLRQPLARRPTPFFCRGAARCSQAKRCTAGASEHNNIAYLPRRGVVQLPVLALFWNTISASAAEDTGSALVPYEDNTDNFSIQVPDGWMFGSGGAAGGKAFSGSSGTRRALAWYPQTGGGDTNVTVLTTIVGADYTKLGSFGSAQDFGNNLVISMDRTYLLRRNRNAGPVQRAKLLDAKEQDRKYLLEYTVQKPEEDQPRHFLSAVSLGFNGRYNKLFTVTAQCLESELPRYRPMLQATINSFTPPAPIL
ncbi:hypothetical protein WJX81_007047 [Elliptochloris bilobata]|uniref:PsbP C-terminal domain-containing protein n=1 Tax=Elliptochloris bilobata TaxID=381761 RepID=A0AAW1RHN0_9CHLO